MQGEITEPRTEPRENRTALRFGTVKALKIFPFPVETWYRYLYELTESRKQYECTTYCNWDYALGIWDLGHGFGFAITNSFCPPFCCVIPGTSTGMMLSKGTRAAVPGTSGTFLSIVVESDFAPSRRVPSLPVDSNLTAVVSYLYDTIPIPIDHQHEHRGKPANTGGGFRPTNVTCTCSETTCSAV